MKVIYTIPIAAFLAILTPAFGSPVRNSVKREVDQVAAKACYSMCITKFTTCVDGPDPSKCDNIVGPCSAVRSPLSFHFLLSRRYETDFTTGLRH